MEFCRLCRDYIWETPLTQVELSVRNLHAANEALDKKQQKMWEGVARRVDGHCRLIVPSLYVASMAVLFSLNFDDEYDDDEKLQDMFAGTSGLKTSVNPHHAWMLIALGVAIFVGVAAWLVAQNVRKAEAEKKKRQEQQALKDAGLKVLAATPQPIPRPVGGMPAPAAAFEAGSGRSQPLPVADGRWVLQA